MNGITTSDEIVTEDPNEKLFAYAVVGTKNDMGEYARGLLGVFATEEEADTFIGIESTQFDYEDIDMEVKKLEM